MKMTKSRYVLLCLLIGIGVILVSCKSDLSKGVDSYYEGNYDQALEHLRKVRYDDDNYEKAVKLIVEINSIPKIVTEKASKRTFPIKVWVIGKLYYSDDLYLDGYISNKDCPKISIGDSCVIDVDAYMNEEFVGIITDITHKRYLTYLEDTIWDITVYIFPESYKHMISEENPSYMPLRSGMSAQAEFITGYLQDILCVPWNAVVHSRYNDEVKYVFIYKNGMVFQRNVKFGDMLTNNGNYMEVIDGLTEEEEVVSDANYIIGGLHNGQTVIKVNKKEITNE